MTTDPRAVRRGRAITEGVWELDPQDLAVLLLAACHRRQPEPFDYPAELTAQLLEDFDAVHPDHAADLRQAITTHGHGSWVVHLAMNPLPERLPQ